MTACGRGAGRGGRRFRASGPCVGAPPRACRSGEADARRGEGTARPVRGACVPAGPVLTTRLLVLGGRPCQVVSSVHHRLGEEKRPRGDGGRRRGSRELRRRRAAGRALRTGRPGVRPLHGGPHLHRTRVHVLRLPRAPGANLACLQLF